MNIALIAVLSTGCGVMDDSDDPRLLVPLDVELRWEPAFNDVGDDLVAVVPVDIMVYGEETGQPYENEIVEIAVPLLGVSAHETGALTLPSLYDCEECDIVWDAYRDLVFEWQSPVDDRFGQNILRVMTDSDGLARAFIVVDSVIVTETFSGSAVFEPFDVVVRLDSDWATSDTFSVMPR